MDVSEFCLWISVGFSVVLRTGLLEFTYSTIRLRRFGYSRNASYGDLNLKTLNLPVFSVPLNT